MKYGGDLFEIRTCKYTNIMLGKLTVDGFSEYNEYGMFVMYTKSLYWFCV